MRTFFPLMLLFRYGGLIGLQMQVMFSPEEDMLSCRRNFHFHLAPLLTGIL